MLYEHSHRIIKFMCTLQGSEEYFLWTLLVECRIILYIDTHHGVRNILFGHSQCSEVFYMDTLSGVRIISIRTLLVECRLVSI